MNIILLGHVDSGKSTICGALLTACEKNLERASELRNYTDIFEEERVRGITVETGYATFVTPGGKTCVILDAPGHRKFIPNVMDNIYKADVALMIVSARAGEFEAGISGGQTREHLVLAKCSGIERVIVVVNKMDVIDYDQKRFAEISRTLAKLTSIFSVECPIIPISGKDGSNIVTRRLGYVGPTIVEAIDSIGPIARNGPIIFLTTDVDLKHGIKGICLSGCLDTTVRLMHVPTRRVVGIEKLLPDRVKFTDYVGFCAGDVLVENEPALIIEYVNEFDCVVSIIETTQSLISKGYIGTCHFNNLITSLCVKEIICSIDNKTGRKSRPKLFIGKNESAIVRVTMADKLCAALYKNFPKLGRFVLRRDDWTVGFGKILKINVSTIAPSNLK